MFPAFLDARKCAQTGLRVVLWQKGHYHYEIEVGTKGEYLHKVVSLPDTPYETALRNFTNAYA